MTKEEILKEIIADVVNTSAPSNDQMKIVRKLREVLPSALDRYALSVVEASVPEGIVMPPDEHDTWGDAFNSCRSQTLENALRIVDGDKANPPAPAK